MDGWHKLKEYRLVVHGCIDGYTRYILYMICATNNRADTVLQIFRIHVLEAFRMCPSRVRGDHGGENNGVEDLMIELRGPGRGSFIRGGSCNNQRIERTWGDVNAAVGVQFYRTCFHMQQHGVLNPDDEVDLYCLHTVGSRRPKTLWLKVDSLELIYHLAFLNRHLFLTSTIR